jgi:hypothetical protein
MIEAGMDFAYQFAEINYNFWENVTQLFEADPVGRKFKF